MTGPIMVNYRHSGAGFKFYVVLVALLAGIVAGVYIGLSVGRPEVAALVRELAWSVGLPVLASIAVAGLLGWLVWRFLTRQAG